MYWKKDSKSNLKQLSVVFCSIILCPSAGLSVESQVFTIACCVLVLGLAISVSVAMWQRKNHALRQFSTTAAKAAQGGRFPQEDRATKDSNLKSHRPQKHRWKTKIPSRCGSHDTQPDRAKVVSRRRSSAPDLSPGYRKEYRATSSQQARQGEPQVPTLTFIQQTTADVNALGVETLQASPEAHPVTVYTKDTRDRFSAVWGVVCCLRFDLQNVFR